MSGIRHKNYLAGFRTILSCRLREAFIKKLWIYYPSYLNLLPSGWFGQQKFGHYETILLLKEGLDILGIEVWFLKKVFSCTDFIHINHFIFKSFFHAQKKMLNSTPSFAYIYSIQHFRPLHLKIILNMTFNKGSSTIMYSIL